MEALPGLLDSLERTLRGLQRASSLHNGHYSTLNQRQQQQQQEQQKQAHQLANYVFFPFSQFLQVNSIQILRSTPTHQAVFDAFLRTLKTLIGTLQFEKAILEQLWTFIGLTLGGPLGNKTFEHAWSDTVRRRLVEIWSTILDKIHESGQNDELELPGPIVAHTLNTILLVLEDKDTEHDTKLSCLECLNSFIKNYLQLEDKVPHYLPGIVSTLAKVIIASEKSGRIIVGALKPLSNAIQASINETRCEALDLYDTSAIKTKSKVTSLEDLFSGAVAAQAQGATEPPGPEEKELQGPFGGPRTPDVNGFKSDTTSSTEPGSSKAWLKATSSQLQRAILSILPALRYHQNAEVRQALAELASMQLDCCFRSLLPTTSRLLLEELLVYSKDTWEQVSETASVALQRLIKANDQTSGQETTCKTLVVDIAKEGITSLPHSIFTNGLAHEATLQRQLNLVISSLEYAPSLDARQLKIERWSLNLLRAVEFAPIASTSSAPMDETSAWKRTDPSSLLLMDHIAQPVSKLIQPIADQNTQNDTHAPPFPLLKLSNVAPGPTITLLQEAIEGLHKLSGLSEILEHFLGIAGFADTGMPIGGTSTVASALWIVQQIMDGLAEDTKIDLKTCSRIIGEVPDVVLSWLNRDDLEEMEEKIRPSEPEDRMDGRQTQNEADDIGPAEIQSGSLTLSGLLNENASRAISKSPKSARRPSYELQVHCMSLRLLAVSAKLLRQDFQKYMMHVLYPLLRALCPSSETRVGILQAHAYCALHQLSVYMGYETPSRMLVENVDYILNSISAHLRGTTTLSNGALDPLAPSVLVSVIELAGEDILPYLGDAVDEIFDALDRWHAYDLLVSELLRVLDRLVNVCYVEPPTLPSAGDMEGRAIEEVSKMQPEPAKDLQAFEQWFASRHDDRLRYKSETERTLPSKTDKLPETNPEKPFKTLGRDEEGEGQDAEDEDDAMPTDAPEVEEEKVPLSKTQALVLAILRKALYFLSHSSAFLRARVLALIASSIPILADRTSDFLPEIHRFWPYILARLDDGFERSPAFVLLEVMRLLIALMKYRGDFMNRRIVKDVLPRLRSLVQQHNFQPTTKNQFTNEYRTLKALLELVTVALRDVPGVSGQDMWTIAVLFRPFLSSSVDPELRKEARSLYQALGQLDRDLVWLVLSSGLGRVQDLSVLAVPAWHGDEPEVCTLLEVT